MLLSINLTIYNKEKILADVLFGILNNTVSDYELVVVLDACKDKSKEILLECIPKFKKDNLKCLKIIESEEELFETKANNKALKASQSDYACIVQDDQVILERGFDNRLMVPLTIYKDVFAVSGRASHNWQYNEASQDINNPDNDLNRWSDVLCHLDHANNKIVDRNSFCVRDSCNRGPLMLRLADVKKLNYLDEIYSPQELCEADLMFRAKKELNKVCGFFDVLWKANLEDGGTRDEQGNTKRWLFAANQKNSKIFYERHKEAMLKRTIENRKIF